VSVLLLDTVQVQLCLTSAETSRVVWFHHDQDTSGTGVFPRWLLRTWISVISSGKFCDAWTVSHRQLPFVLLIFNKEINSLLTKTVNLCSSVPLASVLFSSTLTCSRENLLMWVFGLLWNPLPASLHLVDNSVCC